MFPLVSSNFFFLTLYLLKPL